MKTFQIMLTAAEFAAMAKQIKALPGYTDAMLSAGTLPETEGVLLSYVVTPATDGDAQAVFTIRKKPALVPVWAIQARIQKMVMEQG